MAKKMSPLSIMNTMGDAADKKSKKLTKEAAETEPKAKKFPPKAKK